MKNQQNQGKQNGNGDLRKHLETLFSCVPGPHELRVLARWYRERLNGNEIDKVYSKQDGEPQSFAVGLPRSADEAETLIRSHFNGECNPHNIFFVGNLVGDSFSLASKKARIGQAWHDISFVCTKANDIAAITAMTIDIDRAETAKNEAGEKLCASEEELQQLDAARMEIVAFAKTFGLVPNTQIMSGNGYQMTYFFEPQTETKKARATIKAVLSALNKKYLATCSVDTKLEDPNRVVRLSGCSNRKPDRKEDKAAGRIYRMAKLLDYCDTLNQFVNLEKMASALKAEAKPEEKKPAPEPTKSTTSERTQADNIELVKQALAGTEYTQKSEPTREMFLLQVCLFDDSHTGKESAIVIGSDGKICYQCFHNSCKSRTWDDAKRALGVQPRNRQPITCRKCGFVGEWRQEQAGNWIITTPDGTRHQCDGQPPAARQEPKTRTTTKKIVQPKKLADLMSKAFAPIKWTIPGILPEGATLLAGAPKMGKSILALNIAIAVACGSQVLAQQAPAGEVLYLALEDGERRLRERIELLHPVDTAAYTANFEYLDEFPKLGEGCEESIEAWVAGKSNPRLVVVDTLKKVKPRSDARRATYDIDYESVANFQTISKKYGISILVVHHTKKGNSDDVMEDISGSTGLPGAVDNAMVLKRIRGKKEATLHLFGRDIEEKEMAVALEFPLWTMLGAARDYKISAERRAILDLLKDNNEMCIDDIHAILSQDNTSLKYTAVKTLLFKMSKDGLVLNTGRGKYQYQENPLLDK